MIRDFTKTGRASFERRPLRVLRHALRALSPSRAWNDPPVFILEAVAALASLIALRDMMTGAIGFEQAIRVPGALWATLLLALTARALVVEHLWLRRRSAARSSVRPSA